MLSKGEDVEVHVLKQRGFSIMDISRHLGRDPKTIRRYLSGEQVPGQQLRARRDLAVNMEDVGPERFTSGATSTALVLLDLFSSVRRRYLCGAAEPVGQHGGGGFAREP